MYNSHESNYLSPSFPYSFNHKSKVTMEKQHQLNSSLMRYRLAPSSLLENFIDNSHGCNDLSMFARFMSYGGRNFVSSPVHEIGEKPSAPKQSGPGFIMAGMEHEDAVLGQNASQMIYQKPPMPNHRSGNVVATESSCRNLMAMDSAEVMKSCSNCSNLIRHGSFPAGLFSHLDVENGYVVMRGMGDVRGGTSVNGEATASTCRFNNQMRPLSRQVSLPRSLFQNSEMGTESIGASSPDIGNLENSNGNLKTYISREFPFSSWDDPSPDNFSGLKSARDIDEMMISSLNTSEDQNGDAGNHTSGLIHEFSFPKTSSEIAAMEKILRFQDLASCKIRAKRGCATHPRSIAERVRRTRISQRMRKLQEVVPNMDKQTNTADMLDIAVDYIKDLQRQVKTLLDIRASCICSSKQKPHTDPVM